MGFGPAAVPEGQMACLVRMDSEPAMVREDQRAVEVSKGWKIAEVRMGSRASQVLEVSMRPEVHTG